MKVGGGAIGDEDCCSCGYEFVKRNQRDESEVCLRSIYDEEDDEG